MTIAIPERKILIPPLTFPRWLRHGRARVANMLAPLGGALSPLAVSGIAANPLVSVPWVAQWKFNNNGNDSIGANNLTNNNSATFTTGKIGGATGATQLATASSQYWSIADNAALSMGTGIKWLISLWLYPDSFPVNGTPIVGKFGNTYDYFLDILTGGVIRLQANGGTKIANAGTINTGEWSQINAWYNGTTYSVSINGAAAVTGGSGDTNDGTDAFAVGHRSDLATKFDGRIDNVCVAKSASTFVTQAVLDALWNSGAGTETLT